MAGSRKLTSRCCIEHTLTFACCFGTPLCFGHEEGCCLAWRVKSGQVQPLCPRRAFCEESLFMSLISTAWHFSFGDNSCISQTTQVLKAKGQQQPHCQSGVRKHK